MSAILASSSAMPWSGWFNRDLIENMPVAVYVCDAQGVLVAYNRRATQLWGKAPVLGDTQQKFCGAHRMHDAQGRFIPHDQTPMAKVLESHEPVAFEAMVGRPDGTLRHVSANVAPLFNDDSVFIGFVNCVLDTTDTKRAAEARDRMWHLSPDLMLSLTSEGKITAVNPYCNVVFGCPESAVTGRSITAFIHPDDVGFFDERLRAVTIDNTLRGYESRCAPYDGATRWLSWSAVSDGEVLHVIARDITVQKSQEAALAATADALRHSQKMEAIGLLTGGVAHDFNNLLHIIRGSADLLKMASLPADRRTRCITAIANAADTGAKLTRQLLSFARGQSLKPEVFDPAAGILAIEDMLRTLTGSRIVLTVSLPHGLCLVNIDRSQLDTAIVNLVVNARDAIDGKGEIRIVLSCASSIPADGPSTGRQGEYVSIAVSDTGTGITPDTMARIFEPFFTTKSMGHGTGLGLSQVFGFAKQSGGEILVDSALGQGTTFALYLPRYVGVQAVAGERAPSARRIRAAETMVLIVEDNLEVGGFALEMLTELGYRAKLVGDAEAALAELADAGGTYDAVFSDVDMPGMSGIDLAVRVRSLYPGVPVVLTSGYSRHHGHIDSVGTVVLHKPYTLDQLDATLQEHLQSRALQLDCALSDPHPARVGGVTGNL